MIHSPKTVVADHSGHISDWPELDAAGRSGNQIYPIPETWLIPLPPDSRLYLLPGRQAIGINNQAKPEICARDYAAVAAFLPPGYVALSLTAFKCTTNAPVLPLFSYCAVCWYRGRFHVPAIRVDYDPKHNPSCFDSAQVNRAISRLLRKYPQNRLVAHHGLVCVRKYGCPNAANLFLERWEAPIAVSRGCNASCHGCISRQDAKSVTAPQSRISFTPTVDEILEIAVPHLTKAPRAMISFGQGCEGEPLLQGRLIESAIREIRQKTQRGTIHLNTNGSLPDVVERLAGAGLDSIRISLNSARPELYKAYYRCRTYSFENVMDTFAVARKAGLWVSINYLTFPGVTDSVTESAAFEKLLKKSKPQMIQWRNLNIDPDRYMDIVKRSSNPHIDKVMGIPSMLNRIRKNFPEIRHGYFNPPV